MEVIAYDDKLRARVGEVVVEAERSDLREGRLALVAQNGGAFHSLRVEALDAYRFQFQSSRFATFEKHIGSFNGRVDSLPVEPNIADLLSETSAQIDAVMAPGADPLARQALFDRWVTSLALPLRREPAALHINRVISNDHTDLLVLEGPEPLPFSDDVSLAVKHEEPAPPPPPNGCLNAIFDLLLPRRALPAPAPPLSPTPPAQMIWVESNTRILTNASETVALVIPVGGSPSQLAPLPSREYSLEFALDRVRYRAQVPDQDSNYRASATLTVEL